MSEAAFLRALRDQPDDLAVRLVFADWLEERGDLRGELLRLTHALTETEDVPNRQHSGNGPSSRCWLRGWPGRPVLEQLSRNAVRLDRLPGPSSWAARMARRTAAMRRASSGHAQPRLLHGRPSGDASAVGGGDGQQSQPFRRRAPAGRGRVLGGLPGLLRAASAAPTVSAADSRPLIVCRPRRNGSTPVAVAPAAPSTSATRWPRLTPTSSRTTQPIPTRTRSIARSPRRWAVFRATPGA